MWIALSRASVVPRIWEHSRSSEGGAFCETAGFLQESRADPPQIQASCVEELKQQARAYSPFLQYLSLFPMTVIKKKNYKLCGFKPQKFILLWFWVPEVQNESYRAKIKVSAGLLPSGGPKRKFISCLFQLWGGCQHSLACGCITPISFYLIILCSPFLWSNSPLPPFLRSLVITYRKQIILPFQDA